MDDELADALFRACGVYSWPFGVPLPAWDTGQPDCWRGQERPIPPANPREQTTGEQANAC
jgi:hypothetical protein